jgi:phage FluMu protein Com
MIHLPAMAGENHPQRQFLGVYFVRCLVYGRLYKNAEGTAYEGNCPRCGAHFHIRIGEGGTADRFFKAYCPPPKR